MDVITIPTALKGLSAAGTAVKELVAWRNGASGGARSLLIELNENLTYLDLVATDGIGLDRVIEKISVSEYKRLSKEGFSFNKLKYGKIAKYSSLEGTALSSWAGKSTAQLVESIYDKIGDLKIRYPLVANNKKYKWEVRVNNIRQRIWLLLKHARG